MLCCWDLMTMSLTEIGGGEMERRVTCPKRVLLLHTRDRDITLTQNHETQLLSNCILSFSPSRRKLQDYRTGRGQYTLQ